MPDFGFIKTLLEQASVEGSRSTALKPLAGLIAMLLPVTLASFYFGLPLLVSISSCIVSGIVIFFYLGSYLYLMFKDRDALRSEKYSLQKLAIERGLYGDNLIGTVDAKKLAKRKLLEVDSSE